MSENKDYEKLKSHSDIFATLGVISFIGIWVAIIAMKNDDFNPVGACILLACLICCIISFLGYQNVNSKMSEIQRNKFDEEQKRRNECKEIITKSYKEAMLKINCPKSSFSVEDKIIWFSDNNMYVSEKLDSYIKRHEKQINEKQDISPYDVNYEKISIDEIQYFCKEGDIQYTTKVFGGGGGGSSIKGAVIGGVLAGDAGAIIGSRKKVNEVQSSTVTHDNRETIVRYYYHGTIQSLSFPGFSTYDFLLKHIPNKDLLTIQLNNQLLPVNNNTSNTYSTENIDASIPSGNKDIVEQMKKLKELRESELITEEEYQEKRKKLLSSL